MAAPIYTKEQRAQLIAWLVADYSGPLIRHWCVEREWPEPSDAVLTHYRNRHRTEINALRSERHAGALAEGLALKTERVRRLVAHADELDRRKWDADKRGRFPNEKAWRETLEQIARETGPVGAPLSIALNVTPDDIRNMTDEELDQHAARLSELASKSQG